MELFIGILLVVIALLADTHQDRGNRLYQMDDLELSEVSDECWRVSLTETDETLFEGDEQGCRDWISSNAC